MDSDLLLKFIGNFPDYLLALSCTLLRLFWTTFVETAVSIKGKMLFRLIQTKNLRFEIIKK